MAKAKEDPEREERIVMEIVVDSYDEYERASGWYCYLEDRLEFPFTAVCIEKRPISPLKVKEKVSVVAMADQDECAREMFMTIEWDDEELAVPLSQLKPAADATDETKQAVADWHYWVGMGYEF